MVTAAAAPRVLLALCLRWAGAARHGAGELAAFACPAECQECCAVPWALGLGVSGKKFKCVLRQSGVLPAGRTCAAPERRWHSKAQSKTTCAFSPEELRSKVWGGLEEKCSKRTECCCNREEDWTERICMGMGPTALHEFAVSPRSQVREKYQRQPQQYANKDSACVPERHGVPEGKTYQTGKGAAFTGRGCCLETARRSTSESYSCGTDCRSMGPSGHMHCSPRFCSRDVAWTACARWQRLYHCSSDGGATQTGQLYQRVSSNPGMCLGDHSTPERLLHARRVEPGTPAPALEGVKLQDGRCPAGYAGTVAGLPCMCGVGCGNWLVVE